MKTQTLWQISVATSPEAEEAVAELLGRVFAVPPIVHTDAQTGAVTATVYCPRHADWTAAKQAALRAGLKHLQACGLRPGPAQIRARRLRPENWAEAWKRHFKPLHFGRALLIKPSWNRLPPRPGQAVVVLDPGLSFGTGQHPTTRFCLQQLVACRVPGQVRSFLDSGAGSGILAIAAVKLGYHPVHAFDLDPDAVRVARQNATRNGVLNLLQIRRQDLRRLPLKSARKYDLICANLTADLLIAACSRLVNRLNEDGLLVLAGILAPQFGQVRAVFQRAGLKLRAARKENEWLSGAFQRG